MTEQLFDGAPEPQQPTNEVLTTPTPEVVSAPDYGFDPNDENFQAFNQQLTQYIGVDAYALKNYVKHVESQVQDTALKPLRDEWGDTFADNFAAVKERFKQLSPQQQGVYDNVDGARFIWQQLQNEQAQTRVEQSVPAFDRGKSGGGSAPTGRFTYTQSGITAMNKAEYRANIAAIQTAYAKGLVDLNN